MSAALDLHQDPIRTLVFKMTTPLMLAGLVTTSYNFVDMIFASRLGSVEVASIAFVAPFFMMLQALAIGVIRGGISIIATLLGQQEQKEASAYATQLRLLVVWLSLIFAVPGFFVLPVIMRAAGVSDELFSNSVTYSRILFCSIPLMLMFQLYLSFFKSQGKMKTISRVSIFGVACNAALNAVFLFVFHFEIDGLAYASLLTTFTQLLIIYVLYRREEQEFTVAWRKLPGYSALQIWKRLLAVGLPLSLSQASTHFGFMVLNIFIVQYGHQAVAAFAIGNRIHSLLFFPSKEIASGLIPLIAQNWGRGAIDRVRETIKVGLGFALAFGVFAAVVIQLIKYPLAHFLTNDDPETYRHVINYIGLVGWTVIAWALFHTFMGIFISFQKTLFALAVDIVRLWGIRIPGILLFYHFMPELAEYGIWNTMFISNTVTMFFAIGYFFVMIPPMLRQAEAEKPLVSADGRGSLA
ncbi:MATE family efflux transporter [Reinekea marinisedimentorum]|uniref:Putative MATE family efflux protein n=1 Tax=Reinekea marinisedimentorum TaxID=230495 RepID=A0A4R3I0U5_9GAMM|nr:MATE family efflux transporter [Reinekea marinisedimentorum]TCS38195.1 putative MATE family efflux protein [Reinekea marinisedimentorum]